MEKKTFNTSGTIEKLPKIFVLVTGSNDRDVFSAALAEDGNVLAGHYSTRGFEKHDIGFHSEWKHEKYQAHYPQGYELIWLEDDELEGNEDYMAAYRLNQKKAELEAANT